MDHHLVPCMYVHHGSSLQRLRTDEAIAQSVKGELVRARALVEQVGGGWGADYLLCFSISHSLSRKPKKEKYTRTDIAMSSMFI